MFQILNKSKKYIGFVAGGQIESGDPTGKIFGFRRSDLKWEIMPQQLKTARYWHSVVNVNSDQIPGC